MRSFFARRRLLSAAAVLCFAVAVRAHDDDDHGHGRGNWFSAWTISIGHRMGPAFTGANFAPDLTGKTIRMIVRPTISGNAVRVKIENTQATTAVSFSGAFIGAVDSGAALVPFSNKRLTFNRRSSLTLAAGESAMSDSVRFDVDAFQRLAVSLDVVSASEVSGHQLGLVTNYMATGPVGSGTSGAGFTPVPQNAGNYPFYYVASVCIQWLTSSFTFSNGPVQPVRGAGRARGTTVAPITGMPLAWMRSVTCCRPAISWAVVALPVMSFVPS